MMMMSRLPLFFSGDKIAGRGTTRSWTHSPNDAKPHLALGRHVLRGKHGRVRGGLVTVGLHLHAARHAGQRLAPRQVRHVL